MKTNISIEHQISWQSGLPCHLTKDPAAQKVKHRRLKQCVNKNKQESAQTILQQKGLSVCSLLMCGKMLTFPPQSPFKVS